MVKEERKVTWGQETEYQKEKRRINRKRRGGRKLKIVV